jgi:hypothetical protein
VKNNDGFVLPIVLLLSLLVSVLLAGALALAALRGKLAASASGRLKETSAAEGAVWLGLSLAARDLLVDPLADSGPNLAGPLPTSISTDGPPPARPPRAPGRSPPPSSPPEPSSGSPPVPPAGSWLRHETRAEAGGWRGPGISSTSKRPPFPTD